MSRPNLSVNINKVALMRNARGGNEPNLLQFAQDCESFGAQGITVHPRPDQRHIRYDDLMPLKKMVKTEFNIEGYPDRIFMKMMEEVIPHQCTLVPDAPNVLTSEAGWDINRNMHFLKDIINQLHKLKIRVSLFVEPDEESCFLAKETGADRVEFYTGPYAKNYKANPEKAIVPYTKACLTCRDLGLGINAGHDLNLNNLSYFVSNMPGLAEVSIGHALIGDALYFGIKNTIQMYLEKIQSGYVLS